MKSKKLQSICIFLMLFLNMRQPLFAQVFDKTNSFGNYWGRLYDPAGNIPTAVGIGNFTSATPPAAALNINTTSTFNSNPFFTAGELFLTESPANLTAAWRMTTGNVSTSEKFNITNPTATEDIALTQMRPNGFLHFYAGGSAAGNLRMTIDGSNGHRN
ncbi:MAG: hypothetical protein LH473_07510 [Chitinophagales bacterium]|nr:hypothetical protein [Chitinophagales bacterium]